MDINSTNFSVHSSTILKRQDTHKEFLNVQQNMLLNIIPYIRGLLVYWQMGSGKSRFAIACSAVLNRETIFLSKKSLIGDFKEEIEKLDIKLPKIHCTKKRRE